LLNFECAQLGADGAKSVAVRDKLGGLALRGRTREAIGAIVDSMDISPFRALTANNPIRVISDETEVAARHFVYKLYDTTDGQPMQ
jgi:hypothetical protein